MKRLAGLFWSLLFLAVPIFGVITFAVAPAYDIWLPKDVSEHGASVDGLFYFILWLTGGVFVVTEVALFWFIWKYDANKECNRAGVALGVSKKIAKRYERWLGRGIPATRRGRNIVIRNHVSAVAWYMVQAQTPPRLEEMLEVWRKQG